jgi:signal transduction histidine kinase
MSSPVSVPTTASATPVAGAAGPGAAAAPVERPVDLEPAITVDPGWTSWWRYPAFSTPWIRGRRRLWATMLVIITTVLVVAQMLAPGQEGHPMTATVALVLAMLSWFGVPLLLGPALCAWVRRRGWSVRRELAGFAIALLATVLVSEFVTEVVRPPVKDQLVRWIEGPDAPRTVVMLGLTLQQRVLREGETAEAAADRDALPDAASAGSAAPADPTEALASGRPLGERANRVMWSTLWWLTLLWVAGLGGVLALPRERRELEALRRQRALAQAEQARREAELKLSVLQAQVEPHFLFNTLAGVRGAVSGDPQRAVEIIDRLVDYLRASIPRLRHGSGSEAEATVGAQLEVVRAYLGLMRSRLPRLDFSIDVPDELLGAHCPPLMLLVLVENAVKHGIEPKIGPGRIEVRARVLNEGGMPRLLLSVRDDGVGFGHATTGTGLGLVNLRQRLDHVYGDRARLVLGACPDGGVDARLELPLD